MAVSSGEKEERRKERDASNISLCEDSSVRCTLRTEILVGT